MKMWMHCCLILHNLIIEIEEELGKKSTNPHFHRESQRHEHRDMTDEGEGDGNSNEEFIRTAGQNFWNVLIGCLLHSTV
jgi:hypothetical protein